MINVDNLDPSTDRAKYALALADALYLNDENTLGPTDTDLCVDALHAYAAQVEAGFALVSPPVAPKNDAGQA